MNEWMGFYVLLLSLWLGHEWITRIDSCKQVVFSVALNVLRTTLLLGAIVALGHADTSSPLQILIGFITVALAAASALSCHQLARTAIDNNSATQAQKTDEGDAQ